MARLVYHEAIWPVFVMTPIATTVIVVGASEMLSANREQGDTPTALLGMLLTGRTVKGRLGSKGVEVWELAAGPGWTIVSAARLRRREDNVIKPVGA